jgi:hypothetical protein
MVLAVRIGAAVAVGLEEVAQCREGGCKTPDTSLDVRAKDNVSNPDCKG